MNTPTPDLDLRLAVAKTMPEKYPNARINKLLGYVVYYVDGAVLGTPYFDLSFDAILPLVRGLSDEEFMRLMNLLQYNCEYVSLVYYLARQATPADYCRAYLAAKEQTTPAPQAKEDSK